MREAFEYVTDRLETRFVLLERLALARLEEGFDVFGDATFTRAQDRVEAELDEELADALVYAASILWRKHATN